MARTRLMSARRDSLSHASSRPITRSVLGSTLFISRFPGYCAECATYVATGAGVYVPATVRVYCAEHAPGDLFDRLGGPAKSRTPVGLDRQPGRTRDGDPLRN